MVQVKDRAMVAHSFTGPEFGPAQRLHGMTAVVRASFIGSGVAPPNNTLLDIGEAFAMLSRALDPYRYQNLDELAEFRGHNTTVERMCRAVWESVAQQLLRCQSVGGEGQPGGQIERLRIQIEETDVALAEYEAPLGVGKQHIVLDMDGVLYRNVDVERQIISGLESAAHALGLDRSSSTDLFERYGGTARGLLCEGFLQGDDAVDAFYRSAYDAVDLSGLQADPLLCRQLEILAESGNVQWWLATNSPRHFVERVLAGLRLDSASFRIVCPSSINGWVNKPDPAFYALLPKTSAAFFDDTLRNCIGAEDTGLPAVHVDSTHDVMVCIADKLEVCPRSWRLSKRDYLLAKEATDLKSLNGDVLDAMHNELGAAAYRVGEKGLHVLDLGAGLLSMLRVVAERAGPPPVPLRYTAVDSDSRVLEWAAARLREEFGARAGDRAGLWRLSLAGRDVEVDLRMGDLLQVLEEKPAHSPGYDLILGCSIIDLVDVRSLAAVLRRRHAGSLLYFPIHYAGVTAFEPTSRETEPLTSRYNDSLVARGQITHVHRLFHFLGEALAMRSSPWRLEPESSADHPMLKQLVSFMATNALGYHPRAEVARAVDALLENEQQKQDGEAPRSLRRGAPSLRVENFDFLGRVCSAVDQRRDDANAAAHLGPSPPSSNDGAARSAMTSRLAVEFSGPGRVRVVAEAAPQRRPGELTVRALYTAVSAGTERRVLLSGLPAGEPLDVSVASLQHQQMQRNTGHGGWPIRFGYCLVGQVEEAASSGRLAPGARVFCFHPHASVASVPEDEVIEIPPDVEDEDALFFANMETACSLLQDAAPILGDHVAVFGAGVVGMLTAAALLHHRHEVTVFDPQAQRLAVLRERFPYVRVRAAADEEAAHASGSAIEAGGRGGGASGFDVAIEVSGSRAGLGSAVRATRRGGRLVLGSLYDEEGSGADGLPLGLRFHRSEMTLVASQVSRVAAPLSTRWTKQRRADLTWEMLRALRPSRWVASERVHVQEAPIAYEVLSGGSAASGASDRAAVHLVFTYEPRPTAG